MTTQELHIQLDLLLQKVSSNWNKNFLPQEKDFFLNREILKYIRQRVNPLSNNKRQGAFDTIQRIQNLNSLINTVPLAVNNINQKEAIIQLPFDFLSYISSEVDTYLICPTDNVITELKTSYYQSFSPLSTLTNFSRVIISLTYNLLTVSPITVVLCDSNNFPAGYFPQDNIEDYKKLFIYNNAILNNCISNLPEGFECKFNNVTQQFEFKSEENFSLDFLLVTYVDPVFIDDNFPITSWTKTLNVYNLETELISDIRIIDEEFKRDVKNSNLSGSKENSLIGLLRNKEILLNKNKNAVQTKYHLTYYRKPRKIDLLLNINSDLPDEVLDEIVSNTAQTLKGVISSDTYEKFVQENLLIE